MAGRKENGAEFSMPIKAVPYHHQMEAFRFACGLFGILPGEGKAAGSRDVPPRQLGAGCALLMEMGTGKIADFPYCLVVLAGNGSRKRDTLRHMAGASLQVAVVNYESAWRMEKDLVHHCINF